MIDSSVQYRMGIYYTDKSQLAEIEPVCLQVQERAGAPLAAEHDAVLSPRGACGA